MRTAIRPARKIVRCIGDVDASNIQKWVVLYPEIQKDLLSIAINYINYGYCSGTFIAEKIDFFDNTCNVPVLIFVKAKNIYYLSFVFNFKLNV